MSRPNGESIQLQALLDLASHGDKKAYEELVSQASDRLLKLTRRMLRDFPGLRRWEATDDVFQTAAFRLYRSLSEVKPESVRGFMGLATYCCKHLSLSFFCVAARASRPRSVRRELEFCLWAASAFSVAIFAIPPTTGSARDFANE